MIIVKSHLRAEIPRDMANKNKRTRNFIPLVRLKTVGDFSSTTEIISEHENLSVFEKAWCTIKQFLVNEIHASTKKPPNQIISVLRMETYYDWLQKERNPINPLISDNLNTFEIVYWFLNELSDTLPNSESFDTLNSMLSPSQLLLQRLKPFLAHGNKNPEQMESLIEIVESYKVYDSLLENIQDVLKNLKSEFHKAAKSSVDKVKDQDITSDNIDHSKNLKTNNELIENKVDETINNINKQEKIETIEKHFDDEL